MINTILPPHSDEHTVSWFLRMVYQHGMSIKSFNTFLGNTPYRTSQFSYDSLGTDYYGGLFREIDEKYDNGLFDRSGMDIFKATSLYTGMRALLSEPYQDSFIQGVFDPCTERKYVNHCGGLMVCPACAKEDIAAYHNPYYHRSHHMPGVVACWKHGVKLIPVAKRDIRPFISETDIALDIQDASEEDIEFALFAKAFMEKEYDCSKEDMAYVMRSLYTQKELPGLTAKEEKGLNWVKWHASGSPAILLRLLYLYEKAGIDVDSAIRAEIGTDVVRMNTIKADPRYSFVGDYSNTLLQVEEAGTGQIITTTPSVLLKRIKRSI